VVRLAVAVALLRALLLQEVAVAVAPQLPARRRQIRRPEHQRLAAARSSRSPACAELPSPPLRARLRRLQPAHRLALRKL
jgi:hypothetical protein